MTDSLAPAAVEPLLRGRFGRPYRYEPSCGSTQALLDGSLPEGAVAVCDEQTAGHGRLWRRWDAPPGTGILCSTLLRPPRERRAAELSLIAGLAAAEAVEVTLGVTAQIKWPNDVMVNRSKVAGALAEARAGAVVLGIGINVNQTLEQLPSETTTPPASLRVLGGRPHERAAILALLLERLELWYDGWLEGGIDALYDVLRARDFLRGRRISVDGVSGIALGIDRTGRLALDVEGRRHVAESGEVRYEG
jgi:BirA family biotin operon repressor/biotin-[acetyl-CoA-carboxylase] ligase